MYSGWNKEGNYTDEWMDKTTAFLDQRAEAVADQGTRMGLMGTYVCLNGW
jgi:hypothetical protein